MQKFKLLNKIKREYDKTCTVFSLTRHTRVKKILEQLSRPRFFPGFEISRPFFPPV